MPVKRFQVECYHEDCSNVSREFTQAEFDRLYTSLNKQYQCVHCSRKINAENERKLRYTDPQKYKAKQEKNRRATKQWHKDNPKKSSDIGKKRRSRVKISGQKLVQKAYETIRNDTVKYTKYCEKRKQIALDFHSQLTDEQKENHYKKVFANKGPSKESQDFLDAVDEFLGISVEREAYVDGFFVDGKFENVLIEYYGSTFHCSPLQYHDPSEYCSWIQRTVQEQWDRDKKRLAVFYKNCYDVLVIWDHEWKNDQQKVLERIECAVKRLKR